MNSHIARFAMLHGITDAVTLADLEALTQGVVKDERRAIADTLLKQSNETPLTSAQKYGRRDALRDASGIVLARE